MNERERARAAAVAMGNALLLVAAAAFVIGTVTLIVALTDIEASFGRGSASPKLADYVRSAWPYTYGTIFTASIPLVAGLYFRFVALQLDVRAVEWDELVDTVEQRLTVDESEGAGDGTDDPRPA